MSSTGAVGRQVVEHGGEAGLVEPPAEIEADETVAAPQAVEWRRLAEQVQRRLLRNAPQMLGIAQHVAAQTLGGDAHGGNTVRRSKLRDDARYTGQHVHVLMSVEMTDDDAGSAHAPNLRIQLAVHVRQRDLSAQCSPQQLNRVRRKRAVGRGEADCTGQRPLLREREMYADGEPRAAARKLDGVLERRACRHQRRRRHDAAVVRVDDAAVDGLGNSEVVGIDDELQAGAHCRPANAQCFMPR
jgi:hypothetical protein